MGTAADVVYVFRHAQELLDEKDKMYGDAWKQSGLPACLAEVIRKANYLKAQREHGLSSSDKFREDLIDIINWAALTCWHLDKEENETGA